MDFHPSFYSYIKLLILSKSSKVHCSRLAMFSKHLLRTYYVSGPVLNARDKE